MDNTKLLTELSIFQANLLALVAWADGEVTVEEQKFYSSIIDFSPCDDETNNSLRFFLEVSPKLDNVMLLAENLSKDIIIPVLTNAYLMSASDGNIDEKEKEIIKLVAYKIGINKENETVFWQWLDLQYKSELIEEKLFT